MSRHTAALIVEAAHEAVTERGVFSLLLSGGSTPRRLYELLAEEPFRSTMPWTETSIYQVDERLVPRGHPDSNSKMLNATLLSKIPIPQANSHLMLGEMDEKDVKDDRLVEERRKTLENWLAGLIDGPGVDFAVMGMGPDGHTASIFPGSPLLHDTGGCLVAVVPAPTTCAPKVPRMTLTLKALSSVREAVFLVAGADKLRLAQEIAAGGHAELPAARARFQGAPLWMLSSA